MPPKKLNLQKSKSKSSNQTAEKNEKKSSNQSADKNSIKVEETASETHVYHRRFDPDGGSSLAMLARKIRPHSTVLDLGTGPGTIGKYLQEAKGCIVDGIDFLAEQVELARPYYRKVIRGNLGEIELREHFKTGNYDYIIFADVMEHLSEPEKALKQLPGLLAKDGRILFSVPNVSYVGVISDLLFGEFRYRVEGLLDNTHLRFYTRTSLCELLRAHGIVPLSVDHVFVPVHESEFDLRLLEKLPPSVYEFLISLPDSNVYQFIIEAVPETARAANSAQAELAPSGAQRPLAIENTTFASKVYFALGEEPFVEERSIYAGGDLRAHRQRLRFPLPEQPMDRLRFDPADRSGLMHFHFIKLLDGQGRVLWAWDGSRGGLESMASEQLLFAEATSDAGSAPVFSTGLDPWLLLPIPPERLAAAQKGGELVVELSRPGMDDYWSLVREFLLGKNRLEKERQQFLETQFREHAELHQLRARLSLIESSFTFRMTSKFLPWARPPEAQKTDAPARIPALKKQLKELAAKARNQQPVTRPEMIDVVIPVYGGAKETRRCIETVLAHPQRSRYRVVVVNDGTPDAEQAAWLRELAETQTITLIENPKNLGFVESVNRGMSLSTDNDVVLLNSDTEVANSWLDRLAACAYKTVNIGTVTPFSNNATICSYPRFCKDNELPAGYTPQELDKLFAEANDGGLVDIPTAVGFCMYIRRDCLRETGLFSVEHFGRGYGEENDFCMRASALGWRNVLAADVFVYHAGGVSFADTQNPRKRKAMEILRELHPDYDARVQRHIEKDPARPYRAAVETRRLQRDARPLLLYITHGLGGGTEKHTRELAQLLEDQINVVSMCPAADGNIEVKWLRAGSDLRLTFHADAEYPLLLDWLRTVGVDRIHLHHTKQLPKHFWQLPRDLQVPFDFTAHDYYTFCPQISLTRADSRYCGEPDEDGCNRCLRITPAPGGVDIQTWRYEYQELIRRAERIFCPSEDTARRMRARFPFAHVIATPHPDLDGVTLTTPHPKAIEDRPLRIAVLGGMSGIKGAELLEETAMLARQYGAPIEFHLLGTAYRELARPPDSHLTVHGAYKDEDLPQLLSWLKPDVIWFPAVWPETYSYTLSASLLAGLPIVAPNLGAFSERLSSRPWSFVLPWDRSAREFCDFFTALRRDHFLTGSAPAKAPAHDVKYSDFSYPRDYLAGLCRHHLRLSTGAALTAKFFLRHADEEVRPLTTQAVKLAVIEKFNFVKGLPLFREAIQTIPQGWRSRAYKWLSAGRPT